MRPLYIQDFIIRALCLALCAMPFLPATRNSYRVSRNT